MKKRVESKPGRMVVCWRCANGRLIREQGSPDSAEAFVVCLKSNLKISNPHDPPKSCIVAKAWAEEDAR